MRISDWSSDVCSSDLLSGVVLQALLRNALADPYLLGISAGASTGAVAVTVAGLGAGAVSLSTGAFAGAALAFVLDRKSVVSGTSLSVRVALGVRLSIKKKIY